MTTKSPPKIALPIGDPNGIGPEVVLASLANPEIAAICTPLVIGDQAVLKQHGDRRGLSVNCSADTVTVEGTAFSFLERAAMPADQLDFGTVNAAAGAALIDYTKAGINLARQGEVAAVLAAPHTELSVAHAGIEFSGYPSLLATEMGVPEDDVFLMLLCDDFRIINTTLHEPVIEAVKRLDVDIICRAIGAAHEALSKMNFNNPDIAVCAINPHAGEGGLFGTEDEEIVRPAVEACSANGWQVSGPWPADALFAGRGHDAYVAMYHDQGHIPVKIAAPRNSSAISIGTEIIFGSVAHGSAHDIAGQGIADATAFSGALIRMADQFDRDS